MCYNIITEREIKHFLEDMNMIITREFEGIEAFEAWSGAIDTKEAIINAGKATEFDALLDDIFPNGCTETELNDFVVAEECVCVVASEEVHGATRVDDRFTLAPLEESALEIKHLLLLRRYVFA